MISIVITSVSFVDMLLKGKIFVGILLKGMIFVTTSIFILLFPVFTRMPFYTKSPIFKNGEVVSGILEFFGNQNLTEIWKQRVNFIMTFSEKNFREENLKSCEKNHFKIGLFFKG